jgi:hypothetical protein
VLSNQYCIREVICAVLLAFSDEVYVPYKCAAPLHNSLPHPGDIVEASSLASVSLPPLTYHLLDAIPEEVILSGRLSDLQLEGISYAVRVNTFSSYTVNSEQFSFMASGIKPRNGFIITIATTNSE